MLLHNSTFPSCQDFFIMPPVQPTILIMSVEKEPWHAEMMGSLARLICCFGYEHTCRTCDEGAIPKCTHHDLANAFETYTKDGATVLLGTLLSCFSASSNFIRMMQLIRSRSCRFESYCREDSPLHDGNSAERRNGVLLQRRSTSRWPT